MVKKKHKISIHNQLVRKLQIKKVEHEEKKIKKHSILKYKITQTFMTVKSKFLKIWKTRLQHKLNCSEGR